MSRVSPSDIWLVSLDPVVGREQGGRRPAVVVGSQLHCSLPIPLALVLPCTTVDRRLPHHVAIDWRSAGLTKPTFVRTEDVRAISTDRLAGDAPIGRVTVPDFAKIRQFLRLMLDL